MESVESRLLRYVAIETTSNEDAEKCPTSEGQKALGKMLVEEMKATGITDAEMDKNGYVYGTIESNSERDDIATIGFIAHMDTSPDASGKDVKARIVKAYDGGEIMLNEGMGIRLSPKDFPELNRHKGEDIIVTDGTTLLGADDKAGIAEIMAAAEWLAEHEEVKHGRVRIAFTPDEEIGRGADRFNVKRFGAEWAYTMDGGECGELEYENFNAAKAEVKIKGRNIHPGEAKGKMKNAALIASEAVAMLPQDETPATTEGYEGFYHLTDMSGDVEGATLKYIIRDHDRERFEKRKEKMSEMAKEINRKWGEGTAEVRVTDQYRNMREMIEPVHHIIDIAKEAMKRSGVEPKVQAIRGGTDGAQLSFMGLPCPNIFACGLNFHGRYEYVSVQNMEKATRVIIEIVKKVAE